MAELLISKGANINLGHIIYQKMIVFLKKIMVLYNRFWKLNYHYPPLHFAAENNSKEIGEILISKGADINAKDIIYQIIL